MKMYNSKPKLVTKIKELVIGARFSCSKYKKKTFRRRKIRNRKEKSRNKEKKSKKI